MEHGECNSVNSRYYKTILAVTYPPQVMSKRRFRQRASGVGASGEPATGQRRLRVAMLIIAFMLANACIYGLLIWYSSRSWRHLRPELSFARQVRQFLPSALIFALFWFIGMNVVGVPWTILSLGAPSEWLFILKVVSFIPVLPSYLFFVIAGPIQIMFNPPQGVLIATAGIFAFLATVFVLLLVSFAEWVILRAIRRRPNPI